MTLHTDRISFLQASGHIIRNGTMFCFYIGKYLVIFYENRYPPPLNIDTFNGDCYVSLVAFTMQKIRPRFFPSIEFISDFNEINLRTYINNNGKRGVYFLNIEAGKSLSVLMAKLLSGLPYEKANIRRTDDLYTSTNRKKKFVLDTEFTVKDPLKNKTGLDKWLTERYCLFLHVNNRFYRYDIHHKEWEINSLDIRRLKLYYEIGGLHLSEREPDLTHYSSGVKVIAWPRKVL